MILTAIVFCILSGVVLSRYRVLILAPATLGCVAIAVVCSVYDNMSAGYGVLLAIACMVCLDLSYLISVILSNLYSPKNAHKHITLKLPIAEDIDTNS